MTESNLQRQCNEYLDKAGILYYHREKGRSHKQTAHSKGLPDLMIWYNGRCVFVELKTAEGVWSNEQQEWCNKANRAGISYVVVRTFDAFIHALKI
jgi:hypothetical protein